LSSVSTFSVGSGVAYIDCVLYPGIYYIQMKYFSLLLILVAFDYLKNPIDRLYFTSPMRPLYGIRNTIVDIFMYKPTYDIRSFHGLKFLQPRHKEIREEYDKYSHKFNKIYYHEEDPWFPPDRKYYYYKACYFPKLYTLLRQIPCIRKDTAVLAVMEGAYEIPAHRAESNLYLRYHLTIKSGGECTLYTDTGNHSHDEGSEFLFDHSRYHEVKKPGNGTRVVLILDVHRFPIHRAESSSWKRRSS